ncbi:hypothetical protein VSS37_02225 [Candidatus Thiothrix sp. Deng01]|uniref:Uncharacterized protein n=1 Tax=Candidatus Thiothrix phosphatis TaxID=3112415 RepID=A0ABU6CTD1_9GAMM|nr:hypothetical protein [Candidatus Thiothrix sp. Deng01]MEB4589787.1 hypothetical protein [Candidatus Thiothrix sp. Deng01]
MTLKVVEFKREPKSGDGVVVGLRRLLEQAERGEIVNFFGVALLQDDAIVSGWANEYRPFAMVGGIENAKREMMDICIKRRWE